jgi:hypothetical protein
MRIKRLARQQLVQSGKAAIAAVALLAALTATPGRVRSEQAAGETAATELARVFHLALPPADIALLLDASLSMRAHHYDEVRQAVIGFFPTLTDQERLHLRVFGDTVSSPLEGSGKEVAANVESFLPAAPLFNRTDLGLAVAKGLDFLEREGASPVQALFLLTDGQHDPPADSPYSRDFDTDPDWQALQQRARTLCQKRRVFVYGFGLGTNTDVAVLRRVFPAEQVEVVVGDAAGVARTLLQVRERLGRTQLRQAVEQELREGKLEVRVAQGSVAGQITSFEVPLTVRNGYRHLPVQLDQIALRREGAGDVVCELRPMPSGVTLAPGHSWTAQVAGTLHAAPKRWRLGAQEQHYQAVFQIVPAARFEHEAPLKELGIEPAQPQVESAALTSDLRVISGISYMTLATIGVGLIAMVLLGRTLVKRRQRRAAALKLKQEERQLLAGRLKIWRPPTSEPLNAGADLASHRCRELWLVADSTGAPTLSETTHGEALARLLGQLVNASPTDAESGEVQYLIESVGTHRLEYETAGRLRATHGPLVLCDRDLLTFDGQWRLRYDNELLPTRATLESAGQ